MKSAQQPPKGGKANPTQPGTKPGGTKSGGKKPFPGAAPPFTKKK